MLVAMPLIPGLWKQKQTDLCEFEVSLVYSLVLDKQRDLVLKKKKKKMKEKEERKRKQVEQASKWHSSMASASVPSPRSCLEFLP